jgi:transcriptional regulator with XRE-family HTH domain
MYNIRQMNEFGDWLSTEAHKRGWSQNELARRAGKGSSTMSMIASGQNKPGYNFCIAVARALSLPGEEVLRRAGLLPPVAPAIEERDEVLGILGRLNESARRIVLAMLRGLAGQRPPALDADAAELLAIYERTDPIWRPELVRAARIYELNSHAGKPRIVGEEDERERTPAGID